MELTSIAECWTDRVSLLWIIVSGSRYDDLHSDTRLSFGNRFGRKNTFYLTWMIYVIVSDRPLASSG